MSKFAHAICKFCGHHNFFVQLTHCPNCDGEYPKPIVSGDSKMNTNDRLIWEPVSGGAGTDYETTFRMKVEGGYTYRFSKGEGTYENKVMAEAMAFVPISQPVAGA